MINLLKENKLHSDFVVIIKCLKRYDLWVTCVLVQNKSFWTKDARYVILVIRYMIIPQNIIIIYNYTVAYLHPSCPRTGLSCCHLLT